MVAIVLDHPSQPIGLESLVSRIDELNLSAVVYHLVRKLIMAKSLLRCNVKLQHAQVNVC